MTEPRLADIEWRRGQYAEEVGRVNGLLLFVMYYQPERGAFHLTSELPGQNETPWSYRTQADAKEAATRLLAGFVGRLYVQDGAA